LDYGDIIGTSFKVAWRYKSLWLFGLFASGYASFGTSWSEDRTSFGAEGTGLGPFISDNLWLVPAVLGVMLLIVIAQLLLNAIATPALIDATNRITRGGIYKFGVSLQTGVNFMWRMVVLILLHVFVYIGFFGIMVLIGVLLALALGWLAAVGLLVAIPLAIIFVFGIENIFQLAYRALVARNASMSDALSEGWTLLKTNLGHCVVLFVLYVVLTIAVGILVSIIVLMLALPFIAFLALADTDKWLMLLIGTPLFWIVLLPISGFLGTVYENIYTIFYFRLYEPSSQTPVGATPDTATG
jgi:hypothetical protein